MVDLTHSTQADKPLPSLDHDPLSRDPSEGLAEISKLNEVIELELATDSSAVHPFPITKEMIAEQVHLLKQTGVSCAIETWIDGYNRVGERDPYLWSWCRRGLEFTTLSGVPEQTFDEVCDAKLLGVMFDVLVDDVADQGGDPALLNQLIRLTEREPEGPHQNDANLSNAYAEFARGVWCEIRSRVARLPRYREFAELLRYDYAQLMNTMRYSHLLNRNPSLLNLAEHDLYLPHNMHMMVSATIDVMASPDFDAAEIGRLREAVWHAQYMGRIGNLVTTWPRELREGDFTSGVFAHAVIHGELTLDQLENGDRRVIERAIRKGKHEEYFLDRWQDHRKQLIRLQSSIDSVDLSKLVRGLERLICLHLASRGRK